MKAFAIVACILIVVGVVVLVYGQFSYTKESESAKIGPLELTINEKKTINIPLWVGVGLITLGAGLLTAQFIKR